MHQLPPSLYNPSEKSLLNIELLVKWKKQKGIYNMDLLPKTAILTLSESSLNIKTQLFSKKIRGLAGSNYLISSNLLFVSCFGNGAPSIVSLLEELRGLGVENFIFIGLAGAINSKCKSGEMYCVIDTFSTTGCTTLYSLNSNFKPVINEWFISLKTKLELPEIICWSTDAPFRETASLVSSFVNKGAELVDMECAAIYAFAELYQLNAFCILISADSLSLEGWKPPKNMSLLSSEVKELVKKLVTIFK